MNFFANKSSMSPSPAKSTESPAILRAPGSSQKQQLKRKRTETIDLTVDTPPRQAVQQYGGTSVTPTKVRPTAITHSSPQPYMRTLENRRAATPPPQLPSQQSTPARPALTKSIPTSRIPRSPPPPPVEPEIDDDEFSEDGSLYEDIFDEIELNPYQADISEMSLTRERSAALQHRLRSMGPEEFIKQYVTSGDMAPRLLGTAFGIDPNMIEDDDLHQRILSYAIMRAFRKRQKLPHYNTIDDAAQLLSKSKNVMVITGAGISTSLGIPDFRSKGTGFYDKLSQMGYSDPQEVFDIHNFDENPQTFYSLAGDILPSGARYSPTHGFLKLLQDKGKLQTNYTQNIDNLEEAAGVDRARLIQCHGSFATASCRKCKYQVKGAEIFDDIRAGQIAYCKRCIDALDKQQPAPLAKKPKPSKKLRHEWEDSDEDPESTYDIPQAGVMKPDITFFGEQLPENFFTRFTDSDSKSVDLVIVIGTSLKVAPVSDMPNYLPHKVPHIYISREPVTHINFDIQLIGDCDHVVFELCRKAGWRLEHEMIPEEFQVKVRPYGEDLEEEGEGRVWRWRVKPRVKKDSLGDGLAVHGRV